MAKPQITQAMVNANHAQQVAQTEAAVWQALTLSPLTHAEILAVLARVTARLK